MLNNYRAKGFTFFEVIMALLIAALALTTLMTTQGSLFKRSSQFFHSYQAITALKNEWYKKRWQCLFDGPKAVIEKMKPQEIVNDVTINLAKTTIPEPFVLKKEKSIYSAILLKLNVNWSVSGKVYNFTIPLVIAEEIPQKKESEQKVKT